VIVRLSQQVAQRGLSNAAWSAFYNVVPRERRAQVLSFMDGVPGQLGTSLSGLLLIAAGAFLSPTQVPWIGLVAALMLIWVVLQVRRRYAESLVATLRAGLAEQMLEGGPGLVDLARDPQVVGQLRSGLRDPNPRVRGLSAELIGRLEGSQAIGLLGDLVDDDAPEVRSAALGAMADAAGVAADSAVDLRSMAMARIAARITDADAGVRVAAVRTAGRLDHSILKERCDAIATDADPAVRAELAVALIEHGEEDRPHAILGGLLESTAPADRIAGLSAVARLGGHAPSPRLPESLVDPEPAVRAAAVAAVAALDELPDRVPILVAALDDDAARVRSAAATGLAAHFDDARDALLEALRSGSGRAQDATLRALDGRGPEVREALLAWSGAQVSRAEALRGHARALAAAGDGRNGSDGTAASTQFLRDILVRREWQIEERLLMAVAVAGAPDASGLLRRCLRSNDMETRAQAIEAIDTLGDRALGRALVRLLESESDGVVAGATDVLRALTGDPDPWVRALAIHALSMQLAQEWQATVARARDDPDPVVQSAVATIDERGGPPMPETRETLGEIERMLFLRRVPLFSGLAPEDLQRIGRSAVERVYPAGETIVREGDLGDELVVIAEGGVRIVRGEGADERVLTRYTAGDHIGELAILREQPRAATVIAEPPGVRGLVIGGEGLRAILRERPEAAMAMLATLAERISTQ
jgi:HEAT repeat protein